MANLKLKMKNVCSLEKALLIENDKWRKQLRSDQLLPLSAVDFVVAKVKQASFIKAPVGPRVWHDCVRHCSTCRAGFGSLSNSPSVLVCFSRKQSLKQSAGSLSERSSQESGVKRQKE